MRKIKTANQYLASIGLGPVNPVCGRCGRETGRIYTADKLCVDCLIKQGQIIPQRPGADKPTYRDHDGPRTMHDVRDYATPPKFCSNCGKPLRGNQPGGPLSSSCGCD